MRTSQKLVEKEMQSLMATVSELTSKAAAGGGTGDRGDLLRQIDGAMERLSALKRKVRPSLPIPVIRVRHCTHSAAARSA